MRRSMTTTHSSTSSSSIDSSSNYHTLNPPPPLPNLSHQRSLSMETSSALPTDLSLALSVSFSQRQQGSADWPPIKTLLRRALTDNSPGSPSSSSSCRQMRQTVNNNTSGDNSLFVKVKMEGMKIGRKIDVLALDGYPHLITTLEKMFSTPSILWAEVEQYCDDKKYWSHVLTYEDQDGDWMMVGDVPWEMFLTTVKRLKITRTPSG